MGTEYEPLIFKVNPEYRNWKKEKTGEYLNYSPLPHTQDVLDLPSVLEARLKKYEEKAVGPWEKAVKNWDTEKARVTEMVNFFPSDAIIPQVAVKVNDKESIRNAMFSLLDEGKNCLGVRTCYFPDWMGEAPYSMGKIKDEKGINDFFTVDYPDWLKNKMWGDNGEHLEEIIVQANPPLFGKAGEESKHFVFITIESPEDLLTEVCLNTFHLRSIETKGKDDFVKIIQPIVPGQIFRAHFLQTSIGRKHWNEELTDDESERPGNDTEELHDKYVEKVANQGKFREAARAIASLIFDPIYILGANQSTELCVWGNIEKAISNGTLPDNLCEELIKPRTWEATNNLKRMIHQEWLSPPMDIYLRLMALNNICILPGQKAGSGYNLVEVQGAYDPKGKIEYAKVYALRGREEKEFADRAKRRSTTRAI
ncbi:MAG: hypothetical protein ABIJ85_01570 [bacterium]